MTLNNVELSGKIIKYSYKTETDINTITIEEIENYKNNWKQNVVNVAKNNPKNKSFAHENITFQYFLVDKHNKPMLNFEIIPAEYKN